MLPYENSEQFYASVRATVDRLEESGLSVEAEKLRDALCGSTGGEVLSDLGRWLKCFAAQENVPSVLKPEMAKQIEGIGAAFDRISQPRPIFQNSSKKVKP